jgi:hypothetical protein
MLVTTLLSCRVLEGLAAARLQAIAFFISRPCKTGYRGTLAVTISERLRSNPADAFANNEYTLSSEDSC